MVRVIRFVPRTKAEARATLDQLIAGPGQYAGALTQPIPSTTFVNRLAIAGGVAEVDLSAAFLSSPSREAAVRSITLALTTFPSISKVRITIDGADLGAHWGAVFSGPLARPGLNAE
jgi:spore germination protein GerM